MRSSARFVTALALVGLGAGACASGSPSPPSSSSGPSQRMPVTSSTASPSDESGRPDPTASGPLRITKRAACLAPQPKTLADRVEAGWQPDLGGGRFSALTVRGETVYGFGGRQNGLLALDTDQRSVASISEVANEAAPGWMVTSATKLAWLTYDSPRDPTRWSLYVADRSGAGRIRVAGSPATHRDGEGRSTQPAMAGEVLAWTEPIGASTDRTTLKVMNLLDGTVAEVAEGDLVPPVAMGPDLVWAQQSADGWALRAVDAATRQPVALPTDLPVKDGVGHLAASPERLLWGSADYKTLSVWQPSQKEVRRFTLGPGDEHVFQFMQPTGSHVAWFASWPSSIMDLRNGVFYDVGKDVTVAAAGGRIAISKERRLGQGSTAGTAPARVTVLAEADLPATPACR